jgi:hypothetical protein
MQFYGKVQGFKNNLIFREGVIDISGQVCSVILHGLYQYRIFPDAAICKQVPHRRAGRVGNLYLTGSLSFF